MYTRRFYRDWVKSDLLRNFHIKIEESDLLVHCEKDLEREIRDELSRIRAIIKSHCQEHKEFLESLVPVKADRNDHHIVQRMIEAGSIFNVGPMASVAGAVSQELGNFLTHFSRDVIIENGGDIYARTEWPLKLALYAGKHSPFSDTIRFTIDARDGIGVCTSSGTVGPSFSLGKADAVVAIASNAVIADAAATAIANSIKKPRDIDWLASDTKYQQHLNGLIACIENKILFWGGISLC